MQRNPIGLAHKYWGKKPFFLSEFVISNFTKEWDVVLDPFCWSWSLVIDAVFNNRKLIWIDINPTSILFNKTITNWATYKQIIKEWNNIKKALNTLNEEIYWKDSKNIRTFLREKWDDKILAIKFADWTEIDWDNWFFYDKKNNFEHKWFETDLIRNWRLSVKDNMKIKDFFTDVSLYSHNQILKIIDWLEGWIKDFFLIAFTANIANCSKLLPPIKSRWRFAPWAWMTWFYIAENYLDNNVFHFYINRVEKLLKAKQYFEKRFPTNWFWELKEVLNGDFKYNFSIWNAMQLELEDESIDSIITDPPYEWAVPYLEQSIIWNAFLDFDIDYENEIIVSDAKYRSKNNVRFNKELGKAFKEFGRVLKEDWQLILTYNSINENSLKSLDNLLIEAWFVISEVKNVTQKTATPRQINRANTVKWDLLLICKKTTQDNIKYFNFSDWLLERVEHINFLNYNQNVLWLWLFSK